MGKNDKGTRALTGGAALVTIAALAAAAATHSPATAASASPTALVSGTPQKAETPPPGTSGPGGSPTAAGQGTAAPNGSPTKTPPRGVTVAIRPTKNSKVAGTALFQYDPVSGNTAVRLTLHDLPANSRQTAYVNAGRCNTLSPTLVPFNLLHGDRSGHGDAPAVFPGNFVGHGWSVQVHRGADLTSNTDFFTVACGDIP